MSGFLTSLFRARPSPFSSNRSSILRSLKNSTAPATSISQSIMFVRGMAGGSKKKGRPKKDYRVRMIRYALNHPLTPRPLKFGTLRMLRHWTIHRAWMLYSGQLRKARQNELERQYNRIRHACEELRETDERLYRIAIAKKETGYFPIELRIPTDTPPRNGWNHGWKRPIVHARK